MTNRIQWLLLRLFAATAMSAALACGGDDDHSTSSGPTDPATAAASLSPTPTAAKIGGTMILATTTSTQDSGLLDVLVPLFREQTGIEVKVIAVGTGAALEMAAKGNADAVLVHAPASEKKYIDSGDLAEGRLVMHNDYVLLGPANDPAGARKAANFNAALATIAATGPFISRGDDSGTHKKELELWTAAAIDLKSIKQREETGQGMGATLNIASQRRGYTLSDRATYLAQKKNLDLQVVAEGAKNLLNIYHVYVVSRARHPGVHLVQAQAFASFMVSPAVQEQIGSFRKAEFGQPLFVPDAGKTVDALAP